MSYGENNFIIVRDEWKLKKVLYTQTKENKICLSVYEATLENTIETSRVHDKEMKKMLNFGTHEVTTNLKIVVNSIVVRLKN